MQYYTVLFSQYYSFLPLESIIEGTVLGVICYNSKTKALDGHILLW